MARVSGGGGKWTGRCVNVSVCDVWDQLVMTLLGQNGAG